MEKRNDHLQGLIRNYLPADYVDSFSRIVQSRRTVAPEDFAGMAFDRPPAWIGRLMKLRNRLVGPLGLKTGGRFTDRVCGRSPDEIVFGMPDKHLTFHVSLRCGEKGPAGQRLSMTTVVRFNNRLGRLYFFLIRPFHKIIVYATMKRVADRCARME